MDLSIVVRSRARRTSDARSAALRDELERSVGRTTSRDETRTRLVLARNDHADASG